MSENTTSNIAARVAGLSPEKRALLEARLMKKPASQPAIEPIAVVGVACRFPGADGPDAFWRLVIEGVDAVSEVPADRWNVEALHDPDPSAAGRVSTRWGGFIGNIDRFDAGFFGISPREAVRMDPQQRLLLEVAWEAFEHAGQTKARLAGSRTGVFIGVHSHSNDYTWLQFDDPSGMDAFTGTGTAHNFLSGRLSYLFDLQGPSLVVDTACSSSMVAVHLACQSLRAAECATALVAGVNLMITPHFTIAASRMHMLAPDGRCKAFDARGNGFVRGEGCGAVVLKRLTDAVAAGDRVLAVIRGTAVNQDGHTNGITAPNGRSQEAVIREALRAGSVDPADITYVEAHGTGTKLGDPIEVDSLVAVLGRAPGADPCALGSAKTNIGHLEGAAGIAGLIKAALGLYHRQIPPVVHFQNLNPHIALEGTRVVVPNSLREWKVSPGRRRFAGVSSFGWSGTNAHAVLEEAPPVGSKATDAASLQLVPLSAASPDALRTACAAYATWLEAAPDLPWTDILHTLALRHSHFDERAAVVAESRQELIDAWRTLAAGEMPARAITGSRMHHRSGIVFVFPGQGSQWLGMGRRLFVDEPVFRDAIERCDRAVRELTGWSIVDRLTASDRAPLDGINIIQPTLFAVEVALAALWRSWGIEPDAVVGHSMGEVAAAHVAGALTLEDAARVICRRSELLRSVSGQGAMAVVELSMDDAKTAIAGFEEKLSIAVSNSRRSTVLSGDPAALDAVITTLQQRDVFCRPVKVDVASHSPQMDPLRADLLKALEGVAPRPAALPIYSTVVERIVDGTELDANYWVRNLREPVLFGAAIERLVRDENAVFVECSPHPILLPAIENTLQDIEAAGCVVPSLRRDENERQVLLTSLGALFVAGVEPRWEKVAPAGVFVGLPRYAWQGERFWLEPPTERRSLTGVPFDAASHPFLGASVEVAAADTRVWQPLLDGRSVPSLLEHRLNGTPVLAASVYVDLFGAAAREVLGGRVSLSNVAFERALVVDATVNVQLVVRAIAADTVSCTLFSRDGERWIRHATADAALDDDASLATIDASTAALDDGARFYGRLASAGAELGSTLRVLDAFAATPSGSVATIAERAVPVSGSTRIPFAIVDGCFQAAAVTGPERSNLELRMPRRVARISLVKCPEAAASVRVQILDARKDGGQTVDVELVDRSGYLCVALRGLELQPLDARQPVRDWFHQLEWVPGDKALAARATTTRNGVWLVLADQTGVGNALAALLERRGDRVVRVPRMGNGDSAAEYIAPGDEEALGRIVRRVVHDGRDELRGIVNLWALDAEAVASEGAANPIDAAMGTTLDPIAPLVRELASRDWSTAPRLWLVTSGVAGVAGRGRGSVAQAAIWGMGRVIAEEHREFWGGLIDIDPADDPFTTAQQLVTEIQEGAAGEDQIAFRSGQRAVARLVSLPRLQAGPRLTLRADATYLITGGLGGVGLTVARWAASAGARHLLLAGRHGLPPRHEWSLAEGQTRERIQHVCEIERLGCSVRVAAVDIADRAAVHALLAAERLEQRPAIRGVLHCAAVIDDRLLRDLDRDSVRRVMQPKAAGAWVLHDALGADLDVFVLFSSVGSLLGQAGQATYAAANACLDALAHHRRGEGKPALAVNWGAWRDLGFAATEGGRRTVRALEESGVSSFDGAQGVAALEELLRSGVVQAAVMPVDWAAFRKANPAAAERPLLAAACAVSASPGATTASGTTFADLLRETPPDGRRAKLEEHLQQQLAAVLKIPAARIDPLRPLGTLGLESLLALEFRNRLERTLAVQLPATMVWNHPTVRALATYISGRIGLTLEAQPTVAAESQSADIAETASPSFTAIEELSEEDALKALLDQ